MSDLGNPSKPEQRVALVIDDDRLILEFIETVLSAVGFQVFSDSTGESGLKRIEAARPDIVIVDMRLPGMNGLNVIEGIVRLPAPIPIIVGMSGVWADAEQQAIALGATAFVSKPFTPGALVNVVEDALRGRFVWIND